MNPLLVSTGGDTKFDVVSANGSLSADSFLTLLLGIVGAGFNGAVTYTGGEPTAPTSKAVFTATGNGSSASTWIAVLESAVVIASDGTVSATDSIPSAMVDVACIVDSDGACTANGMAPTTSSSSALFEKADNGVSAGADAANGRACKLNLHILTLIESRTSSCQAF